MMRSRCRLPSQPPRVVFAAKTTAIVKSKPSVPVAFQSQAKRATLPRSREFRLWHAADDEGGAKPVRLCPCSSDINLFSYGESIIDFDAEIPDRALDLRMSQQQLHGT